MKIFAALDRIRNRSHIMLIIAAAIGKLYYYCL